MVDSYNTDECLESSLCLDYYQVLEEPGITGCSHRSDIYLGECGLACIYLGECGLACMLNHCHISCFFLHAKFRSWSRQQNYSNSKIFPIYTQSREFKRGGFRKEVHYQLSRRSFLTLLTMSVHFLSLSMYKKTLFSIDAKVITSRKLLPT